MQQHSFQLGVKHLPSMLLPINLWPLGTQYTEIIGKKYWFFSFSNYFSSTKIPQFSWERAKKMVYQVVKPTSQAVSNLINWIQRNQFIIISNLGSCVCLWHWIENRLDTFVCALCRRRKYWIYVFLSLSVPLVWGKERERGKPNCSSFDTKPFN